MGGLGDGVAEMVGFSGGYEGGGCVEQNDVAAWGFLPGQDFTNQMGVCRGVSAGDGFERCSGQAEFFGSYFVGMDLAGADFSDASGAGDGDFIEAIAAVHDEGAMEP